MKAINAFATFICGVAVGAAAGLLLAPSKGEETREKIKDILRENGLTLDSEDLNDVVDELTDAINEDIEKD
ncbi:MAG: YtxH domain-containing protein [Bacteroidaceae bacterium]